MQENTTMQVWRFVAGFVRANGFAPTLKEIAEGCFLSISGVQRCLWKLDGMGVIEMPPAGRPRAIRVLEQPPGA